MTLDQAFSSILYGVAQFLNIPTMVALVLLIIASVFALGSVVVEYFTERRYFQVNHRQVITDLRASDYDKIVDVVLGSHMLMPQVKALEAVARNMGLPDDELFALAQMEQEQVQRRYKWRLNCTDTLAKVAPMLGLMGTLIPLGPGIVAMGQGDVSVLSSSMLIAFDTTIAGLVCAIVCLCVSRVRRTWYGRYANALNALCSCVLEEAARAREEGVELGYGYVGDQDDANAVVVEAAQRREDD